MHRFLQGEGYVILCRCNTWCLSSGAVRLQTPLLLPRNRKLYEGSELACFMDHSGMLVTLPYDLRVSTTYTRTNITRACPRLHTNSNYTAICISTCKDTHSVRLQSAAALRSCYLRKPWGLNGCFHTVIDYSLVCTYFTVIIRVHPMSQLFFSL